MNKPGKKDLQNIRKYFEVPEKPHRKQEFLEKISGTPLHVPGKTSIIYLAWVQFSYISKWLWALSAFIFVCVFISSRYIAEEMLWFLSAAMPFIVTFSLSESMRSVIYGMRELEMSSRFTLKSIIMLRVIIIGAANMFMLLATAGLSGGGMCRKLLYMLVPYLSSATGGFIILRKFPAREGIYFSSVFGVVISFINVKSVQCFSWIYDVRYTGVWIIVVIALLAAASYESYKMADAIGSRA
ncbi:MAG: hypothetical protein HFH68_09265 [Lachnospiraceae bacterium]|nr:hypothetical protein [Lachnospiraceae bacterium]